MTPIADEGPVGDLVGERVLESVLRLRQHPHFQEQLAGAEPAQGRRDRRRGLPAMASRRGRGTSLPMAAAACSSRLSSAASRSMRAATMPVRWPARRGPGAGRPAGRRRGRRTPASTRLRTSPRGRRDSPPCAPRAACVSRRARRGDRSAGSQLVCLRRRQRLDRDLPVVRLPGPRVRVLGTKTNDEQTRAAESPRRGCRGRPASRGPPSGGPRSRDDSGGRPAPWRMTCRSAANVRWRRWLGSAPPTPGRRCAPRGAPAGAPAALPQAPGRARTRASRNRPGRAARERGQDRGKGW